MRAPTRREIALLHLSQMVIEGAPNDLLGAAPALIAAALGLDYVRLFELLPSGDSVRLMGSTGPGHAAIGSVERVEPDSIIAEAAGRAGQPVLIPDWQDETRLKLTPLLRDAGVTSSVATAVTGTRGERAYGVLRADSRKPRLFLAEEIRFLETVGSLLAHAIVSAKTALSFCALVENTPDLIVWFDSNLYITYANPSIERATGAPADSFVGKTSRDLGIVESLLSRWELLLQRVRRSGHGQAFELTLRTPTGERVFDSRIVPAPGRDGSLDSLFTICRDVTEQRSAEADRLALYEQLVVQQNQVQELMRRLAKHERTLQASGQECGHISDRERHILRLVAAGLTNREIGSEIGLTAGTEKNEVAKILSKLNVTDRTQAAVRAVTLGFLDSDEQQAKAASIR